MSGPLFAIKFSLQYIIEANSQEQKQQMVPDKTVNKTSNFPFRIKCRTNNFIPMFIESTITQTTPTKTYS